MKEEKQVIIYGTSFSNVKGELIHDYGCECCGNAEFETHGTVEYFHLWWIPVIPIGNTPWIRCSHCKVVYEGVELEPNLYKQLKGKLFTKMRLLKTFIGPIIFGSLIGFAAVSEANEPQRQQHESPTKISQVHVPYQN